MRAFDNGERSRGEFPKGNALCVLLFLFRDHPSFDAKRNIRERISCRFPENFLAINISACVKVQLLLLVAVLLRK